MTVRTGLLNTRISRRRFVAGTAALGAAIAVGATCDPYTARKAEQDKNPLPLQHKVWVWQFSADGPPASIARTLGGIGAGVLVKTHDGIDWMSKYDRSTSAVSGPGQVEELARIFEDEGVQFHAWSVVKGIDPVREAQMTADVLGAGARSIVLDLEGSSGFWVGSANDALVFGDELRRLVPFARVDISIDPRPWRIYHNVPMDEFVYFTDGIWPQLYWDSFNSSDNVSMYREAGFDPGPAGITPEFLLNSSEALMERYGRPVIPIGQGATGDSWMWERFVYRAWQLGETQVSVWRHGVTSAANLHVLDVDQAGTDPQVPREPTPVPTSTREPTATKTRTPKPTKTPTRTRTVTPTRTPTPAPSTTDTPSPVPTT